MSSEDINESNFPYNANKPATIIFTVLFALTLTGHIYQAFRYKVLFMLPLIIATAFQVIGYITRYISIQNDPTDGPYIISQVSIVVAPALLAAQDYMVVGRMMSYVGPESTWISHAVITKLFVIIDIICVLTQAGGIAILTSNENNKSAVSTGRAILIAGLIFQVGSFGVFMIVAAIFDWKSRQVKGKQSMQILRALFIAFYISATLVIGRSIYRTIEFATINFDSEVQGYLWDHEWPFYALDAVPVVIATAAFNVVHPAKYLPRKKGLRMDGSVEGERKHWWSKAPDAKPSANPSEDMLMNRV